MDVFDAILSRRTIKEFKPDPANRKVYDKLFREFVNIYKQNRAMYKRLNS